MTLHREGEIVHMGAEREEFGFYLGHGKMGIGVTGDEVRLTFVFPF